MSMEWISQPWARCESGTNFPLMYSLMGMLSCAGICGVLKFHHPTSPAIEIRGRVASRMQKEFSNLSFRAKRGISQVTSFQSGIPRFARNDRLDRFFSILLAKEPPWFRWQGRWDGET